MRPFSIACIIHRIIPFMIMAAIAHCIPAKAETAPPQVSLITCYPGPDIYELCGHTAIRLHHPGGDDYVVNYGLFDFNAPNFVYRFVKGETDYMVGAHPYDHFVESYRRQGRKVVESRLNLTGEQAIGLERMLWENMRPENRTYRYNYVKDNCATRPLEMIERAVGSQVSFHTDSLSTTFRSEMQRYHANYPWYQFGIDLALGSGIDYPITTRERIFAPVELHRLIQEATVIDTAGVEIPVILSTSTIVEGLPGGAIEAPTPWYLSPVALFWVLFAVALALNVRDVLKRSQSRWFDTILYSLYGLGGCLIAFLVFISTHEATSPNWLILWLNPLCFCGAILPWIKSARKVLYYYHFVNFAVLLLLLAGWSLTDQYFNPAFWPLILTDMLRSDNYILLNKIRNANTQG